MNNSIKLAKLWNNLKELKDKLDNEIIPVSGYLDFEDAELITAMQELSEKIQNHFDKFDLVINNKQEMQGLLKSK